MLAGVTVSLLRYAPLTGQSVIALWRHSSDACYFVPNNSKALWRHVTALAQLLGPNNTASRQSFQTQCFVPSNVKQLLKLTTVKIATWRKIGQNQLMQKRRNSIGNALIQASERRFNCTTSPRYGKLTWVKLSLFNIVTFSFKLCDFACLKMSSR